MAAIELTIEQPENNAAFAGSPMVSFAGEAELPDELSNVPIYYRWYSSLFEAAEDRYSMNVVANNSAESIFQQTLVMGTHSITFAASDVAGETAAEFEAIQHAGVTGGSLEGDAQRLVHVFTANILLPGNGASLVHNEVVLQAEAPSQWGSASDVKNPAPPYVVNEDYHAINRLQYRWLFRPVGAPFSRPTREFIPNIDQLVFMPMDETDTLTIPTRIEFTASLPGNAIGQYQITLFVEDNQSDITVSDEQQIAVTLT